MWVSYFLMARDMELSCDESVMRLSHTDIRAEYSASLLNMSVRQSGLPNPLSFCESSVKSRIRNVLAFKKCSRFFSAISATFTVAVLSVCVVNAASPSSFHSDFHTVNGTFIFPANSHSSDALSNFLSAYNLENHLNGRFYPFSNQNIRNLARNNFPQIIIAEYMRPRPTWHNISSFVRPDTDTSYVSIHISSLLDNIPSLSPYDSWLIASYRADYWEIHALYSLSNDNYQLVKIASYPLLFFP
jgi:hypothetical protein